MSLSLLWKWFLRRLPPTLEHVTVVLYTRQGCHLCADAWQRLDSARRRYRFQLEIVDVDDSLELAERFGDRIPVVTVGGKVRFQGALNPVLLNRLLRAEAIRARDS